MIKRLNEQQKAIKEFANRYNIDDLTRNEWSLLQQLEKLLAPAEEASRFVCQDDSPLSVQIAMAKKVGRRLAKHDLSGIWHNSRRAHRMSAREI
jgi:hypothetical protein